MVRCHVVKGGKVSNHTSLRSWLSREQAFFSAVVSSHLDLEGHLVKEKEKFSALSCKKKKQTD